MSDESFPASYQLPGGEVWPVPRKRVQSPGWIAAIVAAVLLVLLVVLWVTGLLNIGLAGGS